MRLATKLRNVFFALIVTTSVAIAAMAFWGFNSAVSNLQDEAVTRFTAAEVVRLENAFEEITRDIHLLDGWPSSTRLANGIDEAGAEMAKDDLATIFRQMLIAKPHYTQVRLIGIANGGQEIVRFDRIGNEVRRVPETELQSKGQRSYFIEALAQPPGTVYYSKISLNREFGEIQTPHLPMLRVATSVRNSQGELFGIMIINVDFEGFITDLLEKEDSRYKYFLTNEEGYYLLHPDKSKTYGFDLGNNYTVLEEFPALRPYFESGEDVANLRIDSVSKSTGRFIHFVRLWPFGEQQRSLALGMEASFEEFGDATRHTLIWSGGFVFALLAVSLFVSNQMTKSLVSMSNAAKKYDSDGTVLDLPTETGDEVGDLARTFRGMSKTISEQERDLLDTNKRLVQANKDLQQLMRATVSDHERKILQANEELVETNKDLEHFTHLSSHELREPLNRICSLAGLLEFELLDPTSEERKILIDQIKSESNRALQQILDFRVFARIGDGTMNREETDLNELVRGTVSDFEDLLRSREAVISIDALPSLRVYKNLVPIVFRNLIENAIKYANGTEFELNITCEQKDDEYIFGVMNTKSEIAKDQQSKVFDIFTRLESKKDGSGMGLSITKRIIDRHAGRIWIESAEGFTHFKFTLLEKKNES